MEDEVDLFCMILEGENEDQQMKIAWQNTVARYKDFLTISFFSKIK